MSCANCDGSLELPDGVTTGIHLIVTHPDAQPKFQSLEIDVETSAMVTVQAGYVPVMTVSVSGERVVVMIMCVPDDGQAAIDEAQRLITGES